MLHFHVSHLEGVFKQKQRSCCQWYNCCVGAFGSLNTLVDDVWSLLLPFWQWWIESDMQGTIKQAIGHVGIGIYVTDARPFLPHVFQSSSENLL